MYSKSLCFPYCLSSNTSNHALSRPLLTDLRIDSIRQASRWATTGHKSGRFTELKQISYRCQEENTKRCTSDPNFGVGAYTSYPQRTGKGWQTTFCPVCICRVIRPQSRRYLELQCMSLSGLAIQTLIHNRHAGSRISAGVFRQEI